jgi:hypothetical protein
MNCDCPLADVCVHSAKPRSGWLQFIGTVFVLGCAIATWDVLLLLGRFAWGKWGWG